MPLPVAFVGGETGEWRVTRLAPVIGEPLPRVTRLDVIEGPNALPAPDSAARRLPPTWVLRGVTSHLRYTQRAEYDILTAQQPPLGRPEASCAALIPITKAERWWNLGQDERRAVLEETSHHIAIGLEYLPMIARRLHHGRDQGEPFDFLTWFEFPPEGAGAFEDLVARLRATPEWDYVEREVDIRLSR